MADQDERTEAPTSKRRSDAREKGEVARSTEINSVLVLLAGLLLIRAFAQPIYRELSHSFTYTLELVARPTMSLADFIRLSIDTIWMSAKIVLPICVGIMLVGVFANIIQVGFLFTLKPLEPKLEKINPLSGFKRLFSMRSLVELVKNLLKITIVGVVAYVTLRGEYDEALQMGNAPIGAILLFLLEVTFKIFLRVALVLLVIAILDFAYQRYEHEKKLRMSKQEVKDEHKQMEGDPKVKARVRSLHMEMARRRMMKEVPKATVVVTNPTHLAIALRYEPAQMAAPQVVAKGKNLIAEQIKKIAREAAVPIVENKPLARAMYGKVEPGDSIPMEFYTAVAEILAYIYKMKDRRAA